MFLSLFFSLFCSVAWFLDVLANLTKSQLEYLQCQGVVSDGLVHHKLFAALQSSEETIL